MIPPLFHVPNRRRALGMAAAMCLPEAHAQEPGWPVRPVRLVVAFPPGGLADVMARSLQPQLAQALDQPVLIDNRTGAGGNVAGTELLRGGDGHSFLVTTSTTQSVNPLLFARMPFDPDKDLQPVALLANSQLFLITRPTLAPATLKEFLAFARAHPTTLNYGSAGNGTTPHLAGELLKQGAAIRATHVPYRGAAPAIQDVMAGQIDFAFSPGTALPAVKAGKLKVLAVASRQRSSIAPEVPTFAEEGIADVYADTLFGVYAPATMPAGAVTRMGREINRILAQPAIRDRWVELGAQALPLLPAEYKALVRDEARLFQAIVKARGITAD